MSREVEAARRRLERGFGELRGALAAEIGWSPRGSRWALPIVAGAVGLVAALFLRRNLPRLRSGG